MSDAERPDVRRVPKYPNSEDERAMSEQVMTPAYGPDCGTCLGTGLISDDDPNRGPPKVTDIPWPACSVPAYADEPTSYDKLRGAVSQADVVPEAQDAINEMVENGWHPEGLMRHLRLLGPELELWATKTGFPRHSGLFMLSAATAIENLIRSEADLEAKLEAERTLRAQTAAELEREKAREQDRRREADAASRDRLWAIDALVEALGPLAGYATEEDGRVAGMTSPVCLAMSSVRRADALVKLHRALRR